MPAQETDPEFGREVLRRKVLPRFSIVPIGLGVVLLALGITMLAVSGGGPRGVDMTAGILLTFAGLVLFASVFRFRRTVILFERGAVIRARRGGGRLAYEEVGECTISRVRQHVQGAYIGTYTTLSLQPQAGAKAPRVRVGMKTTERKQDGKSFFSRSTFIYQPTELDSLASYISTHVAEHLLTRVDGGESIPWGANLTVSRLGLTHKGFASQASIPWDDFAGFSTDAKGRTFVNRINGEPLKVSWPANTPNLEALAIVVATLSGIPAAAPEITPATASL